MQKDTIYHPSTCVNGYLCFVKSEKNLLLDNGKLPIHIVTQSVEYFRVSVINICLCKHEVLKFTSFIAYQMKLEAKIPSHRTLANLCIFLEYLVSLYALVVAYGDTSAVDKTYAGTPAETE